MTDQTTQLSQRVLGWRPLALTHAAKSIYCACGHRDTFHVVGPFGQGWQCNHIPSCPCKLFAPILSAEEILAEITSESGGDPLAVNPGDPSFGLLQVTFPIAKMYAGVTSSPARLADPGVAPSWGYDTSHKIFIPDVNMTAGANFLAHLKALYAKDHPVVLPDGSINPIGWIAAYNEGEPNLWKKRPDPDYVAAFVSHLKSLGVSV